MANDDAIQRIETWLDGGCNSWGVPAQDIRTLLSLSRNGWQGIEAGELAELRHALKSIQAFVGVMFGVGPECAIPETVPTPLGIPVKIGAIMREVSAALAKLPAPSLAVSERFDDPTASGSRP